MSWQSSGLVRVYEICAERNQCHCVLIYLFYFIFACSSTRTKTDAHSLQSPFHMCLTKKGLCSIDMGAKLNKLMYTTNLDAATGHLAQNILYNLNLLSRLQYIFLNWSYPIFLVQFFFLFLTGSFVGTRSNLLVTLNSRITTITVLCPIIFFLFVLGEPQLGF